VDRFEKKPESFLRKSPTLKPQSGSDQFNHYRAKTGHDSRFGKAKLTSRIRDLSTESEFGQSEEDGSPVVVMASRADKRFDHDTRSNPIDMNRAYKRRFGGKPHYNDLDRESVLPDTSARDSSFVFKRHLKRVSRNNSNKSEDFKNAMPFMNEDENKEAVMDLNERLMENRADATMHRGRDPTEVQEQSDLKDELEKERDYQSRLEHLKKEKQKMYFKQFERAWEELRKSGKRKGSIRPESFEPEGETPSTETTDQGMEGVNANVLAETQE